MKKKILIITLVLTMAGAGALGYTLLSLTPQEAYEAASENNLQFEINELNLQLKQITHDKNEKTASLPALNNYYGQLSKYYNPFNSETALEAKKAENERAEGQLKIDVMAAAVAFENASISYDDAKSSYTEAKTTYEDGKQDSSVSEGDLMLLKYSMDNASIVLVQAENNLESAQRKLDSLTGIAGSSVILPSDYPDPYKINPEIAYENALETDIGIYQSSRNAEAAKIKLDIASEFYEEDEETYVSALAGLKSAELAYEKNLLSLETEVLNDIDSLKTKFDSINLAMLNKEIKQNDYDAALRQYDAGIISAASLESSEAAYNSAVRQLDSKIHDFILAFMRFELDYGYSY